MEQFASCRLMFSLHRGCEVKFDDLYKMVGPKTGSCLYISL